MTDKRTLILQVADKLFVEQGIKGTTIAQIADTAGIAKGSVYSYFKNKAEIVRALFIQSFERSQQEAEQLLNNIDINGLALLEAFIVKQLCQVEEERAFQQAWMTDDSMVMENGLLQVVQDCRTEIYQVQLAILARALGQECTPWRYDLLTMINGQIQEFAMLILLDNMAYSHVNCAAFIARSARWTLIGLLEENRPPVLDESSFVLERVPGGKDTQLKRLLTQMRSKCVSLDGEEQSLVSQTLDLIEQQIAAESPNTTLLRALIANLRPYLELADERAKLAELLDVALI
ncbi:TetR/AcrR family transcriptional regulator [Bowmanella yangjiangensis]|uniref:TetR/AcrR family transcriptional regulator n=1 Tax=Bowmanella yangjiangensis TaxID=2811230 RepID=A0ABS3CZ15_9ALTE|nr:TetR/AcrR family transcriptional regulator [Bowmanella yangjiangensis]MBN7820839.1 TetR/AcrR family transcriptional regulator [Bowmanella yangjiangensis]